MPSATAVLKKTAVPESETANSAAEFVAPRRAAARRRTKSARSEEPVSGEPVNDSSDDGFGSGLAEAEAPAKPARRKTTRKKTANTAAAKAGEEAAAKVATRRKPAKKKAPARKAATKKTAGADEESAGGEIDAPAPAKTRKKPATKRTRVSRSRKKPDAEEIDLSEFDFGNDDGPRVPINPAATAAVKPKRSVVAGDDFGVRLSPSVAKSLAAEKLAETLDSTRGSGSVKKGRRGRRGKKGPGGDPQPAAAPRGSGKSAPKQGGGDPVTGVLEMHPKGYGFLRDASNNYVARESDPFVSGALVDRFRLREGVTIDGEIGPGNRGQGPRLKLIKTVDGVAPEEYDETPKFDELTPVNPVEQIILENGQHTVSTRVMDLLTPLGKGQRALIVAPPRSGKTVLLREMADSISENHPEVHLIVLLIDERPEEVTEMQRTVNGEVIASSLDHDVESHIRVSQLVIERAKRMAEAGEDVVVLLDSITRLARAFNKWTNSGRVTQGGIDIKALDIPKKLFGTARKFEEGGSVTVVGTVLVETGSRGDDVIFQEFKGTGNMELVLSRSLADRRIFPAIDIPQSSTRREELLLDRETHESVNRLRRSLISLSSTQAMEDLSRTLQKFETNQEFLDRVLQVM